MAMQNDLLGIAALGGLTALVASCWAHIKAIVWRVVGFVISSADITDPNLANILISHLAQRYRRWGNYDRIYKCGTEHIREQERKGFIPYEYLGETSILFWNGILPVYLAISKNAPAGQNADPSKVTITARLIYLRGTFNPDKIIIEATREYNSKFWEKENAEKSKVRRFYVKHVPSFEEKDGAVTGHLNGSSGYLPWWQLDRYRLLGFEKDQLGLGHKNKRSSLEDLIFPRHITELIEEIKLWHKSRDWYHEKGIPWKRGYLCYGPPGCVLPETKIRIRKKSDEGKHEIFVVVE